MAKQKDLLAGVVAGVVGGLAAAWMVNEFMAGLPPTVQPTAEPESEELDQSAASDAMVPYAFGALTGGVYGALSEYSPTVRSGFGTSFGGVLFTYADVLEVPAFGGTRSPASGPGSEQATPFAAHIVYGLTTELVRRIVRLLV